MIFTTFSFKSVINILLTIEIVSNIQRRVATRGTCARE